MKKVIVLTFTLFCTVLLFLGCAKEESIGGLDEIVAVIPIEANRIKIAHEAEKDRIDFEVTFMEAMEVEDILGTYNSMKIRQMSKPLKTERYIIKFYLDDTEIAVWRVDSELTTSCSNFGNGNHVIENEGFDYNYFEKLLKR